MHSHEFSSDKRHISKHLPDFTTAYIFSRYREVRFISNNIIQIHDFLHILLGKTTSVPDELLVKWFEMIQLGIPVNIFCKVKLLVSLLCLFLWSLELNLG